jgi:hypothetical protein
MKERIEKDIKEVVAKTMRLLDLIYYNGVDVTPEKLKVYYYRPLREVLTKLFEAFNIESLNEREYDSLFTDNFKFFYSTNIALEILVKVEELHSNESLFKRIFIRPFLNRLSFSSKIIDDIAKGVVPTLSLNEVLAWVMGVENKFPALTNDAKEFVVKVKQKENYFQNLFENDPLLNSTMYKQNTKEGIMQVFKERDEWIKLNCTNIDNNKDFPDNPHVNKYVGNLSEYVREHAL